MGERHRHRLWPAHRQLPCVGATPDRAHPYLIPPRARPLICCYFFVRAAPPRSTRHRLAPLLLRAPPYRTALPLASSQAAPLASSQIARCHEILTHNPLEKQNYYFKMT